MTLTSCIQSILYGSTSSIRPKTIQSRNTIDVLEVVVDSVDIINNKLEILYFVDSVSIPIDQIEIVYQILLYEIEKEEALDVDNYNDKENTYFQFSQIKTQVECPRS